MKKRRWRGTKWVPMGWMLLLLVAALCLFPLVITLCASFMGEPELAVVFGRGAPLRLIPYRVTLDGYFALLIQSQNYLNMFWNALFIALSITAGQVCVAALVAFLLAKVRFRFSGALLFLYIVVTLMPYQVTLLPNYLLARQLGLYNTWGALILPGIFAPFGVFLLHQFMKGLPGEILEAALLETSSLPRVLWKIVLPIVKPGLLAAMILAFSESWNMVDQPLILLKDEWLYPLSLALNGLRETGLAVVFPGAVLYVAPTVLLYFLFEDELISGLHHLHF